MRARPVIALIVAVTLTAACGGDSDSPESEALPGATSTQNIAADKAAAEQAVLRLSDFPPGWQAKPHEESPDDPDLTRRLGECLRVDVSVLGDNPASADSPDFESPDEQEVQSSVGFTATAAKAQELFAIFERPETPGCLSDAASKSIEDSLKSPEPGEEVPAGVTVGKVSINRASFPAMGERTVAYRMTVPVRLGGLSLSVYSDLVLVLRGRGAALLSFFDFGSPFPTDQAQKFTKTVVDRLPA